MNHAVGGAVCGWREGGGVNGAGNGSPVGEFPASDGDIGLEEISGCFCESECDR